MRRPFTSKKALPAPGQLPRAKAGPAGSRACLKANLPILAVPGTVWLAADIHLSSSAPATRQAFFDFLERAAREADALLLCGDIFDAWVGDDVALLQPEPWLEDCLTALQQTARRLPLYIGRGNRDFLMGKRVLAHLGAHLLAEQVCLHTDFGQVIVSHGDEYCTDDLSYQRFKRIVRNPWVQKAFLWLPQNMRQAIARKARQRSRAAYQHKGPGLTDVNPKAITQMLARTKAPVLIHGHTHRPALHHHLVGGKTCTRLVLPDWQYDQTPARGGWAVINQHGVELHYWCS